MASYKMPASTNITSRMEPTSTRGASSSTRLPTRKQYLPSSQQSLSGSSVQPAPSKLTKRRPAQDVESVGRMQGTHKGEAAKGATGRSIRKPTTLDSSMHAAGAGSDVVQNRSMLPTTSSRTARGDLAYTRTPSLVSGSSASTLDSPRSNILRRKPSLIGRHTSKLRKESLEAQEDTAVVDTLNAMTDPFPDSILGIAMPSGQAGLPDNQHGRGQTSSRPAAEYQRPVALPSDFPAPPAPLYALSTTPSTLYSGSPGPFSVSSTPTSMSSFSPATTVTSRGGASVVQSSPTRNRLPMSKRSIDDEKTLSAVRESSSSSGSTTRRFVRRSSEAVPSANQTSTSRRSSISLSKVAAAPSRPRTSQDRTSTERTADTRPKTAIPPELAHLMDAGPLPRALPPIKPVRPSRDGTPEYTGLIRDPSPIIQSNLQSLPYGTQRRPPSMEYHGAPGLPNTARPTASSSRLPSRNPSPSPSQLSTALPPRKSRGMTPDAPSDSEKKSSKITPPSPSKSGSRFGFFRRKTEPPAAATPALEKRSLRKGPAAGTGHEGYGRYAPTQRGRSGSTTSGTSSTGSAAGRSPSADSGTGGSLPRIATQPGSRKSSVGSKGSGEMDDFLRERLTPVTLRGSGEIPAFPGSLYRTQSEESSIASSLQLRKFSTDTSSSLSAVANAPVLKTPVYSTQQEQQQQPATKLSPVKRDASASRDTVSSKETSSSSRLGFKAAFGSRRLSRMSMTLDSSKSPQPVLASRKPAPQQQASPTQQPWQSSHGNASAASLKAEKQTSLPKPQGKLTRKWNFFHRAAQTAPVAKAPAIPVSSIEEPRLAPALQYQPSTARTMAHYALPESGSGGKLDMDELERIMQEATHSPADSDEEFENAGPPIAGTSFLSMHSSATPSLVDVAPERLERTREPSMLLPSPPLLPPPGLDKITPRAPSPKVQLRRQSPDRPVAQVVEQSHTADVAVAHLSQDPVEQSATPPVNASPPRPSRLQQVGRIPQVVRDRERQPSVQSFSRPFGVNGTPALQQQSPNLGSEAPSNQRLSQPPQALSDMVAQLRVTSFTEEVEEAFDARRHSLETATTIDADPIDGAEEFLALAPPPRPRQDSDYSDSATASSSGQYSFGPLLVTAPPVAVAKPVTSDDDVWREYDDLIDDVLKMPAGQRGVHGKHTAYLQKNAANRHQLIRQPASGNPDNGARAPPSLPSITSPASPYSVTDFLAAYGARASTTVSGASGDVPPNPRLSVPPGGIRSSVASTRFSVLSSACPGSRPTSSIPTSVSQQVPSQTSTWASSPATSPKDVRHVDVASLNSDRRSSSRYDIGGEENEGAESLANVRFGALMTSKWLSFGRVLFSPAHFELKDPSEDRVLIVDGLGKDWSFYVALTYQNASVYSLGPDPSAFPSTKPNPGAAPFETMPNHRHIHHPKMDAPFPFPKGFFAAVVFRFPVVASESAYRTTLNECKRVLRPGGYLEISVLDMDLVNMGNQARKAVRGLKMRMAERSPELSLKPLSDVMMRLIGRRGFEGVQRCVVGVPAAGPIKHSGDATTIATEGGDGAVRRATPVDSLLSPAGSGDDAMPKSMLPFSELLRSDRDGGAADDGGLSRMVARVGRWWYEKCYEAPVLEAAGATHIWRDEALLSECERQGTTFRLLICCAQKPTGAVRRTVSV